MKIKVKHKTYEEVMALPRPKHRKPARPWFFLRTLIRLLSVIDLWQTRFRYAWAEGHRMPDEPCLILMNHSSFIDLKIASRIFYPKPFAIVSTTDGFVGKGWLMRRIGCIPTHKFVSDLTLIRDMKYALQTKKIHVLMFPEAGYTLDGCSTRLPEKFGDLVRLLKVPVVMVKTQGAFARDPLYNGLRNRRVRVSAEVSCLLSKEDVLTKDGAELDRILRDAFTFDGFAWQKENGVEIREPFRAEGLERLLYRCPACGKEGEMTSNGSRLGCRSCGKAYELDLYGQLCAVEGETEFPHIPDWFRWERECVREELLVGDYAMETEVKIAMLVDHRALYMVGEGVLRHGQDGFSLTGCEGKLQYTQKPLFSHSLNVDYYWYRIGDVIALGNRDTLYYCFPKREGVVTKTRLAAEELFGILMTQRRAQKSE